MKDKPWSPEDLFKPSKEYPQGSSGEWMAEENGVMVQKIYRDGKLVATEVVQLEEHEMKFYTDLKGTVEAKPGDLVALAVSEYGGMLHQPEVSKRPCLSADGKSAVFDWKEVEGGPFMTAREQIVLLRETLCSVSTSLPAWQQKKVMDVLTNTKQKG